MNVVWNGASRIGEIMNRRPDIRVRVNFCSVGYLRPHKIISQLRRKEEDPLSYLRHAKIGSVQCCHAHSIAEALKSGYDFMLIAPAVLSPKVIDVFNKDAG